MVFLFWRFVPTVVQELKNVTRLFEVLKQKNASQTTQGEAGKRLKDIVDEVEKMKRGLEDKHRQIQGTAPPNEHRAMVVVNMWNSNGKFCVPRAGGQNQWTHQE